MYKTTDLFDMTHSWASDYLLNFEYPFDALSGISQFIKDVGAVLPLNLYDHVADDVWISKTAKIAPTAFINGPCIIGHNTEVRHCAFIRGAAFVGENCVVGNSVELKNVILFDNVQVPHFNYVGDSILGYKAHMGAGSVTSNVKSDKKLVTIKDLDGTRIETCRKKVGAMLGDFVEVGCNSVLNPGTVIGRNTNVYPLSCVRGVVPENSIYKNDGTVVTKK